MQHKGLRQFRFAQNPLEALFAAEWQKLNETGRVLEYILTPEINNPDVANLSERDMSVAATVVQWLGTPVGQGLIRKVQEKEKEQNQSIPKLQ